MFKAPLISIVDDDALVCDGIAALVESLGYNTVTFTAAEHFLQSDVIAETTCAQWSASLPALRKARQAFHQRSLVERLAQVGDRCVFERTGPVFLVRVAGNDNDRRQKSLRLQCFL